MKINFSKYNGAGNDFIVIDDRESNLDLTKPEIYNLCNRNIGIGGDGLILIKKSIKTDFEILHYTSDGNLGSLCGNGSRCAILYAYRNNIINKHTVFKAFDGIHEAEIITDELITMQMKLNSRIIENEYGIWVDTGSPHLVVETTNTDELDVKNLGRSIRYNDYYKQEGVNVNFVERVSDEVFKIRTYERGVEDETRACGTGSTASAICMNYIGKTSNNKIKMKCLGGDLEVKFLKRNETYSEISITGPAKLVFEGSIDI
jgi:diaminopimelate epimerase